MNSFSLEYNIDLPKAVVWDKLFDQLNQWWSKDFYTNSKTKSFIIESTLGGKMYEDFGNGEGLIWGDIIGVDKPNSLMIRGMLSGEFGGPTMSYERFLLTEENEQTKMIYSVEFINEVSEKTIKSLKEGWETIFKEYFIPFCTK
jgi:uncharacterized protein YndB with AHSA1/START domain